MQKLRLLFEISPWFIALCLLAGAVYAFILYQKEHPWDKKTNYLLAGLRFLAVSILAFLLLGPFIRQIVNTFEKPAYVFAIDNSLSVSAIHDSVSLDRLQQDILQTTESLAGEDFDIVFRSFEGSIPGNQPGNVQFDHQITDLNNLLKQIQSDFEGRNLAGVVLFSDGIYNQGISPSYANYSFPVYTVALGDTIPKKDLNLKNLYYNKISYQGNKFPIIAEIANNGFENTDATVTVKQNGKLLATKTIRLDDSRTVQSAEFLLEANEQGMQHYVLEVTPREDEFTPDNNVRHAYIDVIEGKEKILIAAFSPHPDIKAISSALEENKNYEITLYIPSIDQQTLPEDIKSYNLVIFHQVPGGNGEARDPFQQLIRDAPSSWFITGNQSNLQEFNRLNGVVNLRALRGEEDKVVPAINNGFNKFNISSELRSALEDYSPVSVPFGDYQLTGPGDILLYQQVGSVTTNKPLLMIGERAEKKTAVLFGEGIWRWRLQEYANTGSQQGFDELVSKLVQYLASKEDQRKFRVYPVKDEFTTTEPVLFETEIYNDIYEPIYGQRINLRLTAEDSTVSNYTYTTNENSTRYRISGLPQGVYKYHATTSVAGTNYNSGGEFRITELILETQNLTANHQLLKTVASRSGGGFYFPQELVELGRFLQEKEVKSIIYSDEEYLPVINVKWIFFLLLALLSAEWFLRKYSGSY